MFAELISNITHNMFKPLLLFFYAGFAIPMLKVKFEFPKVLYQSITIYLLVSIGWHGGEELASLSPSMVGQAVGFMFIGFITNTVIGFTAYGLLRKLTPLRKIDAATVAGYYGSDSAGTFLTCIGVLTAAQIAYAPYMPVMLAIMEIPGCLVALILVSQMRKCGMDKNGNMPGERDYQLAGTAGRVNRVATSAGAKVSSELEEEAVLVGVATEEFNAAEGRTVQTYQRRTAISHNGGHGHDVSDSEQAEADIALQQADGEHELQPGQSGFSLQMLHEVFFNPGIYLLFAGIAIGFISKLQGEKVITGGDQLFVNLFQGVLCLFLLEMGITAAQKLKDLKTAGPAFVMFGLIAPNLFAIIGISVAHGYSLFLGQPFEIGTYVLFAVLCGAASYIALPAVQRMAIPEASPTLPLAASLGLTFSYNVTIGIPVYIFVAKAIVAALPVYA